MDVQQLRYFLAVIDHGSVHAAASAVGVSQPTVSQSVRTLERELGTPLFDRIGRGMAPTSAGYAAAGPARRVVRAVDSTASLLPGAAGELRGGLDIVCRPSTSVGALPALVARFRRAHPDVILTVGLLDEETPARAALRDGAHEIVVAELPAAPGGGQQIETGADGGCLQTIQLDVQEFLVVFPPHSEVLPAHDPIRWDELPDAPLVVVPPGSGHAAEIQRALSAASGLRQPAAVVENRDARMPFTLAGVGGTFIERSQAAAARRAGAMVRALDPPVVRRYGLIFDPGGLSPNARAFVEIAGVGS